LSAPQKRPRFRQRSMPMGDLLIDVTNVAEALDIAEGPDRT
jgi:hypothetical protein